ncbi:hypothetical protein SD77_3214 [Bacillus badius]|uniref:Uncharacterized protein n=1 Tax=Bacillus badius TaxID=1455 RepID=A0ABR5AXA7_BACBA|nr:hypothetical protein SD78_0191 [Bacillus badius]KIL79348.1 hypothetical protein SD77_3214 [Bacillus badius]
MLQPAIDYILAGAFIQSSPPKHSYCAASSAAYLHKPLLPYTQKRSPTENFVGLRSMKIAIDLKKTCIAVH